MNESHRNRDTLTSEQSAALDVVGVSVALSAGAGCGKTTVLTRRYLAMLEGDDPPAIETIVVLTFTEKAARELRDRVRRLCSETRNASPESRRILASLESAKIGTFHAFCGEILRTYAFEAGLDPGFEILDEVIAPTIRQEALTVCMRRWLSSKNPALFAMAVDYGLDQVRQSLLHIIANRPDFDMKDWSERPSREVVRSWEAFAKSTLVRPVVQHFQEEFTHVIALLRENTCNHTVGKQRSATVQNELINLNSCHDVAQSLEIILENAKVQGGGTKASWPSEAVYEEVKTAFTKLRAAIPPILELIKPDEGRSLPAAEAGLAFARLAHEAIEQYHELKRVQNCLDFQDLQTRLRDLLIAGPIYVRKNLQNAIRAILVDEFQDTDPMQSEILEILAGPELIDGRLFLVGDIKQSIYGFRGAQPSLFEAFRNRFREEGRLNLTFNFRSVPGILSFVNELFAEIFPGSEHALQPGREFAPTELDADPCVEFLWVGGEKDAHSRRNAEAETLAQIVARRIQSRWRIRDPETGAKRDANPGDIVLLFRSRSDFPLYEQALANAGLEYHVVGGTTFFSQQEIIDVHNLLAVLENPLDSLALAGALRGPFFCVSDEALFWLAREIPGDLSSSFAQWEKIAESLDAHDREAVERAAHLLSRWRDLKDHLPIASLLNVCLDESGFEAALLAEFLGGRKRANVRKLVRLARRFDLRGGFTLSQFVEKIRNDLRNPPREEQATTTDEHGMAVRLMTIHQAKGLEFPIVIIPDLDRKSPVSSPLVESNPHLGLLVRPKKDDEDDERPDRNLGRALHDALEKQAEADEDLRCLYVATTRARDVLILSAGRDPEEKPKSPALRLLNDRFDLLTGFARQGQFETRVKPIDVRRESAHAKPARSSYRPTLLYTASRILRASVNAPLAASPSIRPEFLDLEAGFAGSIREKRLRDLLLATIEDRGADHEVSTREAIQRAAESRGFMMNEREIATVVKRLMDFHQTAVWRTISDSHRVHARIPWTASWPANSHDSITYQGRIDFCSSDQDGTWQIANVITSDDISARLFARLNLLLSATIAESLGIGQVQTAQLAIVSSTGTYVETLIDFNAEAVNSALDAVFIIESPHPLKHRALQP